MGTFSKAIHKSGRRVDEGVASPEVRGAGETQKPARRTRGGGESTQQRVVPRPQSVSVTEQGRPPALEKPRRRSAPPAGDVEAATSESVEREVPQRGSFARQSRRGQQPDSRRFRHGSRGGLDKSLCMEWEPRFYRAVHESLRLPEIFKTLRERIHLLMGEDAGGMSILVTSALPGEGKSFVSANLAVAFSEGVDRYALLCDSDLRRPALSRLFGRHHDSRGLVDYLRDGISPGELIAPTGVPKLSILPAGVVPENPAELVSSEMMRDLVEELTVRYEDRTIIFDSPPIMAAAETRTLASQVDGVVIVVRQGVAGKAQVEETIDAVGRDRILGIVFNDFSGGWFSKASKYGYGMNYSYGD